MDARGLPAARGCEGNSYADRWGRHSAKVNAAADVLLEEEIGLLQLLNKAAHHRAFVEAWCARLAAGGGGGLSVAEVWKVREACIRRLSR